jgi:hypothetical protein
VADVDIKDGGFAKVLASLKGEHDCFPVGGGGPWRKAEGGGQGNLMTDQDISDLKTLNAGRRQMARPHAIRCCTARAQCLQ